MCLRLLYCNKGYFLPEQRRCHSLAYGIAIFKLIAFVEKTF